METNNAERQHNPRPEHPPNPLLSTYRMSPLSLHFSSCWNKLHPINMKLKPSPTTVKVQPAITDSYRAIIKALAEKHTEFDTYQPK
jgi:hypothetical protein